MNNVFRFDLRCYLEGRYDLIKWYDNQTDSFVTLHPKQVQAMGYLNDNAITHVGYGGAAYGGKSTLISMWFLMQLFTYPGTRYLLGRKEMIILRKTTWDTLLQLMQSFEIDEERDYHYNRKDEVLTFENGSQIYLLGTNVSKQDELGTRFGSLNLTAAAIDESNESQEMAIDTIFSRTGRMFNFRYGIGRKLLETFNPSRGHVYQRYWKPYKEGHLEGDHKRRFVYALPLDNPSPQAKDYVEGIIANGNRIQIERLVKGNFEYEEGDNVLCQYDALTSVFNSRNFNFHDRCITMDIALHGSNSFVMCAWYGGAVVEIRVLDKCDAKELLLKYEEFRSKHGVKERDTVFDSDGIGAYLRGFLPEAVFFNGAASPVYDEAVGSKERYQNLRSQCYYLTCMDINNGDISVMNVRRNEVRQRLIDEFAAIKVYISEAGVVSVSGKDELKATLGSSPDISDAIMMKKYRDLMRVPSIESFEPISGII